jgi:hypothetical protein
VHITLLLQLPPYPLGNLPAARRAPCRALRPAQEMNEGSETCRFLQLWITPDRRGHKPQYGSSLYDRADRHNRLLQILGGTGAPPAWPHTADLHSIKLHQVRTSQPEASAHAHVCVRTS